MHHLVTFDEGVMIPRVMNMKSGAVEKNRVLAQKFNESDGRGVGVVIGPQEVAFWWVEAQGVDENER